MRRKKLFNYKVAILNLVIKREGGRTECIGTGELVTWHFEEAFMKGEW